MRYPQWREERQKRPKTIRQRVILVGTCFDDVNRGCRLLAADLRVEPQYGLLQEADGESRLLVNLVGTEGAISLALALWEQAGDGSYRVPAPVDPEPRWSGRRGSSYAAFDRFPKDDYGMIDWDAYFARR